MERFVWVMLGGAIGSAFRYGLAVWLQSWLHVGGFPWWTLIANVLGSFLIGLVMAGFLNGSLPEASRLFFAVGVLGGFTTFSSFSYETLTLLQKGETAKALLYVASSLLLGLLAVVAGFRVLRPI